MSVFEPINIPAVVCAITGQPILAIPPDAPTAYRGLRLRYLGWFDEPAGLALHIDADGGTRVSPTTGNSLTPLREEHLPSLEATCLPDGLPDWVMAPHSQDARRPNGMVLPQQHEPMVAEAQPVDAVPVADPYAGFADSDDSVPASNESFSDFGFPSADVGMDTEAAMMSAFDTEIDPVDPFADATSSSIFHELDEDAATISDAFNDVPNSWQPTPTATAEGGPAPLPSPPSEAAPVSIPRAPAPVDMDESGFDGAPVDARDLVYRIWTAAAAGDVRSIILQAPEQAMLDSAFWLNVSLLAFNPDSNPEGRDLRLVRTLEAGIYLLDKRPEEEATHVWLQQILDACRARRETAHAEQADIDDPAHPDRLGEESRQLLQQIANLMLKKRRPRDAALCFATILISWSEHTDVHYAHAVAANNIVAQPGASERDRQDALLAFDGFLYASAVSGQTSTKRVRTIAGLRRQLLGVR